MENPNLKWMRTYENWGYPYFRKPPYRGNITKHHKKRVQKSFGEEMGECGDKWRCNQLASKIIKVSYRHYIPFYHLVMT